MALFGKITPLGFPFGTYKTGVGHSTPFGVHDGTAFTTTGADLYYAPFPVLEAITFTRAYTYNQGSGDNGEVYRVGCYANDGATAGPGTRILDFGEVTLTGAAALRTQTISLNLTPYVGQIVWLAYHANSAAAMHRVVSSPNVAALSFVTYNMYAGLFGNIAKDYTLTGGVSVFRYVNTAYGALASTAVAPTLATSEMPIIALGTV